MTKQVDDQGHVLTPSKPRKFPQDFYFLDTETSLTQKGHITKVHSLKIGICQHYRRIDDYDLELQAEKFIDSQSDFLNWLLPRLYQKSHAYLIAHNVVYDATILDLFRLLPKHGYKLQSLYSKGQTSIIRWKRGTSKLTMLDNGNIFGGTLERWGKIFGIPKLSIDFDTCTRTELEVYCRRDVEIMVRSWRTWMEFIHVNNCGGFRETVGSTAFNTWRHAYMPAEIYVHKEDDVLRLEREAYHGGRVEVFHQGQLWTDHYYYLDINNMYGHVMKTSDMPSGLVGYSNSLSLKRMITYLEPYAVIARLDVNVDEPAFIHKVNGHAAYPTGRFTTVLTTDEIIYALEHGWVEKLHSFAWYRKQNIFSAFIDKFYGLRMEYRKANNVGFEAICKLIINSLSGKFGQTGIEQKIVGQAEPNEVWTMPVMDAQTGKHHYRTALGGSIYETIPTGESYHAIPAIAAHVTANARLYLFSLLKRAGLENVYYCDTDSLVVNSLGYYNLEDMLDENKLGMLKIETHSPYLIVNAPKDYEMSERRKVKGVRHNAVEIAPGIYEQEQWVKLAGLIRSGFAGGYTSKSIVKHQERVIYSGTVTATGRVEPFHL